MYFLCNSKFATNVFDIVCDIKYEIMLLCVKSVNFRPEFRDVLFWVDLQL